MKYLADSVPVDAYQSFTDSSVTLDLAVARSFRVTMSGNLTINFTHPPASGRVYHVLLALTQDGVGTRSISAWHIGGVAKTPAYSDKAAPVLASGAGARTDLHVIVWGDGTLTVKLAGFDVG